MNRTMKRNFLRAAVAAAALGLCGGAFAQADKPLKIVVGTPAGASMDTLTRLLADKMRVSLNRPVVVENRAAPRAASRPKPSRPRRRTAVRCG